MAYEVKKVDPFSLKEEIEEITDTLIQVIKTDTGYFIITETED
jgi:hypothetical protein